MGSMVAPPSLPPLNIDPCSHPGTCECEFNWEKAFGRDPNLAWDLNPMTGVLMRERQRASWDTDGQEGRPCEDRGRH